jgi:hypothetical protein
LRAEGVEGQSVSHDREPCMTASQTLPHYNGYLELTESRLLAVRGKYISESLALDVNDTVKGSH